MVRDARRACEARALHTQGSRLRRFAPSENVRKRLFCSLERKKKVMIIYNKITKDTNKQVEKKLKLPENSVMYTYTSD